MHLLKRLFCGLLSLQILASSVFAAADTVYAPAFEPGYKPAWDTDEGGLWYKVEKSEQQIADSPYLVRDEALNAYVSDIVCELAGEYCPDIRVYIVENPHFNAFMTPNGMMVIWTGLLLRAENEAQLATILSHEIAHYLRAHMINQWRKLRKGLSTALFIDMFLTMGLATLAVAGSNASYGRKQETEADLYGLQLMMNAGYQPTEAVQLWRYLDAEYTADKSKSKRSGFWASHPKIGDRIAQLEQRSTDTAIEGVVAREAYIAQVSAHYKKFMHNHLQMQEHEQTEQLLKKHLTLGYSPAEIHYFYGELYRTRNNTDDRAKAIEAYSKAIAVDEKLAIAYKELGYLYLKNKNNDAAKFHLTRYLEQAPETSDRAMIEYYLNMLRNSDE